MSAPDSPGQLDTSFFGGGVQERVQRTAEASSIVNIRTVRSPLQPNVLHVEVTDSEGLRGLGETFYGASVVEAQIHDVMVPILCTENPSTDPREVFRILAGYVGYTGSGAEVRAQSAIDIALWDLAAQRASLPLRTLLNPGAGESIPVYNTCSGENYVNQESRQSSTNWGLGLKGRPPGPYEDLWRFLHEPGALAKDLVAAGYPGMKVWPFDREAEKARGGKEMDFDFGLGVLREIRSAVGNEIELYLELHSLLGLEAAKRLCDLVEGFNITWIEDPLRSDRIDDLVDLRRSTGAHIAMGETMGAGLNSYPALIAREVADTVIMDLGWCGGITTALDVLELAHQTDTAISYHDCTGPVSLAVAGQLAVATPQTVVQEVARSFWHTWYPKMADGIPHIEQGVLTLSGDPGHGAVLSEQFLTQGDTLSRDSSVQS
jgi:L-alanine-DL-glutamate epimerase-like enolase superfamily enzyme